MPLGLYDFRAQVMVVEADCQTDIMAPPAAHVRVRLSQQLSAQVATQSSPFAPLRAALPYRCRDDDASAGEGGPSPDLGEGGPGCAADRSDGGRRLGEVAGSCCHEFQWLDDLFNSCDSVADNDREPDSTGCHERDAPQGHRGERGCGAYASAAAHSSHPTPRPLQKLEQFELRVFETEVLQQLLIFDPAPAQSSPSQSASRSSGASGLPARCSSSAAGVAKASEPQSQEVCHILLRGSASPRLRPRGVDPRDGPGGCRPQGHGALCGDASEAPRDA